MCSPIFLKKFELEKLRKTPSNTRKNRKTGVEKNTGGGKRKFL
jgi:hypothetical protein